MANWNGNNFYREYSPHTSREGTWGANPPHYFPPPIQGAANSHPQQYALQQQYVSFDDFVNQFQQTSPYQNYSVNAFPVEQQNIQGQRYVNRPQFVECNTEGNAPYPNGPWARRSKPHYQNASYVNDTQVPFNNNHGGSSATHYSKEKTSNVAVDHDSKFSNKLEDKKEPLKTNEETAGSQVPDSNVATVSKLTATAQEFVPQSLRNSVVEPEQEEKVVLPKENTPKAGTSNSRNNKTSKSNKNTDSPKNSNTWNSNKKTQQERYKNTNWRSRDESELDEQSQSGEQVSHTVYNSNSQGQADKYSQGQGPPGANSAGGTKNRGGEKFSKYKSNNSERNFYSNDKTKSNSERTSYLSDNRRENMYRSEYNDDNRRGPRNSTNNGRNRENDETNTSKRNQYSKNQKTRTINSDRGYQHSRNRNNETESFPDRTEEYQNLDDASSEASQPRRNEAQEEPNKRDRRSRNEDSDRRHKNSNNYRTYVRDTQPTNKDTECVGQRERLMEQLLRGTLECLVCCEAVRQPDAVWSCSSCYHVLHLACVRRWAVSSITDGEWRCPACQHKRQALPTKYLCFCGARQSPEWRRGTGDTPHSCGEPCSLRRSCALHACTLPCHPGPCPTCEATVQGKCECGATSQWIKCSLKTALLCGGVCQRSLNCGAHSCTALCHAGPCEPCSHTVHQTCYCTRKQKREVACSLESVGVDGFSCGEACERTRPCGNHPCPEPCHPGACPPCPLAPEAVTHCPCQQSSLKEKRSSCLDPVPTCDKLCSRLLHCGPPNNPHTCQSLCHHGDCPICPQETQVTCRCGQLTKNISCGQLEAQRDSVRCGRKCTKKQSCGRHHCKETCCAEREHRCLLPCTRTLSCGLHRCEDTCHRAHCQPCWRVSFEELRCRCGASVRYPPVECGARPPACDRPCSEVRPCGHEPLHSCHPSPSPCPPCTVLTQRHCYGRHKIRKTIPCHQEEFSCGLPCGKELSCGKHKCIEQCHKGDCPQACSQLCEAERVGCGHPCASRCGHPAPCPSVSACRASVTATCPCGRRTERRPCHEQRAALRRITALPGPLGEPIDIAQLIKQGNNNVTLECDLECQIEDRNRRLAIGLQIRNPDLSSKLAPKYSDYLKQMTQREEPFASRVHEQLSQLVLLAKQSKQRTRSHSFQPMSRQKRQFVHEMCQHFGCDSAAYDSKPYRNIVATAYKERSWLPALSVLEVVRRERGQRKVPPPVLPLPASSASNGGSTWATLGPAPSSTSAGSGPPNSGTPEPPRKPRIDYFDCPPED